MKITEEIAKKFDEMKLRYQRTTGENNTEIILIDTKGDVIPCTRFAIFFNDETRAQIVCFDVCRFSKDKNTLMLQCANTLNSNYRLIKFFLAEEQDNTGKLTAIIDLIGNNETEAMLEMTLEHLGMMIHILDKVYPKLMKILYN